MIQTGNEKTSLSTNTVVMFYSWTGLQVTTALCYSSVNHGKQGTEAKQPSPFMSQLPFEPHRFDLMVGLVTLVCVQNILHKVIKEKSKPSD